MRKKLCSILALVIAFSFSMTGCKKKQASTDDIYTVDWYLVCNTLPSNTKDVEAKVNEYIKDKIGAKLKMHYLTWTQYDERLNIMNAGGDKYDICWTHGDTYKLNSAKNAYLPLNDLIDKYAPKTKKLIGDDFLRASQINGVNYGLPANKDKGRSVGILYRKDLAEKYDMVDKLNGIKSFDELYPLMDVIKQNEPDIEPLREDQPYNSTNFLFFDTFAFPAGIYLDNPDEVVNYVDTPQYKAACEQARYNYLNKYSWRNNAPNEQEFIQIDGLNSGKAKELNITRKYEWVQVELTDRWMTASDATGSLMAISRASENPEKAMKFLELFNTDKYLNNLIVFGIEGVNYNKVDENIIEIIENSGYGNAGMQWMFGNISLNYTVKGEDPDKWDKMEKFNESLKPAADLGFVFDQESVKTEIGACQNVKAQYGGRLEEGIVDVDKTLAEYKSKLKSAGSDKIMEEVKKQYKEWKKKK